MKGWQTGLLILFGLCVFCGCITLIVFLAGGFYVAKSPDVQAKIIVSTFNSNAKNVYSYYSNITSNVNCLPLAANLAYLCDQNGSIAISSGTCPSGTVTAGPAAGGFTVCNLTDLMSNSVVVASFNNWANCMSGSSTSDPRSAVWLTGQMIQGAPLEISAQTIPFTFEPSGIDTSAAPSYTMSMDINIAETGSSWRNVFNNGTHDCCDANARHPAMFITGTDYGTPNKIHIVQNSVEDVNKNIVSDFAATLGKWFNVTWVVSGGVLSTYFNGVADKTVSGTFNWGTAPPQWRWNQYVQEYTTRTENTKGSVKVANVYFWKAPLTASQITKLAVPAAETPGVSTTSYYTTDIRGYSFGE